jgi:hypothetical protein
MAHDSGVQMTIIQASEAAWARLVAFGSIIPHKNEDIETQRFRWRNYELRATFDITNIRDLGPFSKQQIIDYFNSL